MIKRKFGMTCLNISQGRYNAYSHKNNNAYDLCGIDSGIDKFTTFNDLYCLNFQSYKSTGFGNTVLYYDKDNDVTLAFTHSNVTSWKVGQTYKSGEVIYYEGTTGKATGNHIHLEIGKGKQTKKAYFKDIKLWKLKDEINIEDYFYIDKSYTTIKNDKGYLFSYTQEVAKKDTMSIKEGYQEIVYNNHKIHVYKQLDIQDIGMMSADTVKTIDKIDDNHVHYCKINANYFNLSTGEHYGVEQSFTLDNAPKSEKYIALYVDNNNEIHYELSNNYWLSKSEVKFAMTPFCVLLDNGKDVDVISTAYGDKRNTKNSQTLLMQLSDKRYCFAIVVSGMTPYDCRTWAKSIGATFLACFDSGGSSQMIVNGTKKVYTGRALPNVLTFYKAENNQNNGDTDTNTNSGDNSTIEQLKAEIEILNEQIKQNKQLVSDYSNKVSKLQEKLNKINEILKGD